MMIKNSQKDLIGNNDKSNSSNDTDIAKKIVKHDELPWCEILNYLTLKESLILSTINKAYYNLINHDDSYYWQSLLLQFYYFQKRYNKNLFDETIQGFNLSLKSIFKLVFNSNLKIFDTIDIEKTYLYRPESKLYDIKKSSGYLIYIKFVLLVRVLSNSSFVIYMLISCSK